jgi:hypothetical protein
MKRVKTLLRIVSPAALLAMAIGCTTTTQTENLLSAAGFKAVPAVTPAQEAHLKTLPPHKITMAQRDGKPYYTFPDVAHKVLYVGQESQYQEYQKLRLQKQMAAEELNAAEMNNNASWGVWGGWEGGWVRPH